MKSAFGGLPVHLACATGVALFRAVVPGRMDSLQIYVFELLDFLHDFFRDELKGNN